MDVYCCRHFGKQCANFFMAFVAIGCWWYRLHFMFICSLGGVDHNNLGDMVYKYVWLLYIHIKSAMMV